MPGVHARRSCLAATCGGDGWCSIPVALKMRGAGRNPTASRKKGEENQVACREIGSSWHLQPGQRFCGEGDRQVTLAGVEAPDGTLVRGLGLPAVGYRGGFHSWTEDGGRKTEDRGRLVGGSGQEVGPGKFERPMWKGSEEYGIDQRNRLFQAALRWG